MSQPTESPETTEPPHKPAPGTVTHVTTNLPQSNIGWAVASAIFFWPLSFSAFANAWKVYPLWSAGDAEGAEQAATKAKQLGKISLLVGLVLIFLFVVFRIVLPFWFWRHNGCWGPGGWGPGGHEHGDWGPGGHEHGGWVPGGHEHGGWGPGGTGHDGPEGQPVPPVPPQQPLPPVPPQQPLPPVPPTAPAQPAPRI